VGNGNGKDWSGDDEVTPIDHPHGRRSRLVIPANPAPVVLPPPMRTDPPTRRHIADVWKSTIVSVWALTIVGVLAGTQHWPYEVTLGAIGALTGLWTLGAFASKK